MARVRGREFAGEPSLAGRSPPPSCARLDAFVGETCERADGASLHAQVCRFRQACAGRLLPGGACGRTEIPVLAGDLT